jgi:hypothetical protein
VRPSRWLGSRLVGLAALGLPDGPHHQHGRGHTDRADDVEGDAPVERCRQCRAKCNAERRAERGPEVEDRHRGRAPFAREGIRYDGVGWRHAPRLAHADQHARDDQLAVVRRHPASSGRSAPDGTGGGQDLDATGAVGQPAHRDGDEAVEQREIEACEQPELPVGDAQAILDRLGQDRDELAVQKVEHIDKSEHA